MVVTSLLVYPSRDNVFNVSIARGHLPQLNP
jgi:hypothetical protein